jgi:hypothetical protein
LIIQEELQAVNLGEKTQKMMARRKNPRKVQKVRREAYGSNV